MTPIHHFVALLLACTVYLAPGNAGASDRWVELAGERYAVEIAATDDARARGLMFRERLEPGTGMLFIHAREERQAYWMKNTLIPLDILYFDSARRLVSQQRGAQPCPADSACPAYPSRLPARYVLELNAGEAARLELVPGTELLFGPGIPAPD